MCHIFEYVVSLFDLEIESPQREEKLSPNAPVRQETPREQGCYYYHCTTGYVQIILLFLECERGINLVAYRFDVVVYPLQHALKIMLYREYQSLQKTLGNWIDNFGGMCD